MNGIDLAAEAPKLGLLQWLAWRIALGHSLMWPEGATQVASRLDDGARVVLEGWPGIDAARTIGFDELLAHPRMMVVLGVRGWQGAMPDFGPPDLVLDDAAPWVTGVCAAARGLRVDVVPGAARPMGGRGAAWLVGRALGWMASPVECASLESLIAPAWWEASGPRP